MSGAAAFSGQTLKCCTIKGCMIDGFCNHDLIYGAMSSYQVCGLIIYYHWVSVSSSEKWGIQHLSLLTVAWSSSLFFLGSPFFRSSSSLWLYSKWLEINPIIFPTFLTWLIVSTFLHSISLMPDSGCPHNISASIVPLDIYCCSSCYCSPQVHIGLRLLMTFLLRQPT